MQIYEKVINHLRSYCDMVEDNYEEAFREFVQYNDDAVNKLPEEEIETFLKVGQALLETYDSIRAKIYIYSALVQLTAKEEVMLDYISWFLEAPIDYKTKYSLYRNISAYTFFNAKNFGTMNVFKTSVNALKLITEEAAGFLSQELLAPIPVEERDKDFVIVITSQLLGDIHGPTKHTLDHCLTLMNTMHKKVLLINTAEIGQAQVLLPTYNHRVYTYIEKYSELNTLVWKGTAIPFFQCDDMVFSVDELNLLLTTIRQLKPYYMIEVGCGSLLASLASNIVPILTNGTMHSLVEPTVSPYQTIARPLTEEENNTLLELGYDPNNIIQSMFTTAVRPETEIVNRLDWGVPEGAFLVGVVGTRLNTEVTEELIDLLNTVTEHNIYYIFFGNFDKFMEIVEPFESRNKHMIYYGSTKDTMACLKQCDMYFNPHRVGGGMSAIEAMAAGLPAVSTAYGDGGVVLGKDFWVEKEEEIPQMILKYATDHEFYKEKAKIARERGEYLQNSDLVFKDTLEEFVRKAIK